MPAGTVTLYERWKEDDGRRELVGYYANFYETHPTRRRKRLSLGTKDANRARRKLAQWEREYYAGAFDPFTSAAPVEGITAAAAVDAFLKDRKARQSAESTLSFYGYVLGAFEQTLAPGLPLAGVRRSDVERYLANPEYSDVTRNNYAARLRTFFGWCIEQGFVKESPVPPKANNKASRREDMPEFMRETEVEWLLKHIEEEAARKDIDHGEQMLRWAIRFGVTTGLRRKELCNLRWGAVDLEGGMLRVRNQGKDTTKSGKERPVPLAGDAVRVLREIRAARPEAAGNPAAFVFTGTKGGKLNGGYASQRFRLYRRSAGLSEEYSIHTLRHTFASWFVQRGGDPYKLQEIMGHSRFRTTQKYAHLSPDSLQREMLKTFGGEEDTAAVRQNGEASEAERLRQELEATRAELERLRQLTYEEAA